MNVALISPSQNLYSETFIQAHKNYLKGKIFFYYGEKSGMSLEGEGLLSNNPIGIWFKLRGKIEKKPYSYYFSQLLKYSLKNQKIDIVLAEYGPTANSYLHIIKQLKIPLIVHFHGYDASRHDVLKKCNNYQEVFQYASFVVVVSKKMYKDLYDLGCPEEKLIYTVCGPNDLFFDVLPRFENLQYVAVGRFVDKKAPYYTILAFAQVVQKFPEAKLVMAGSGILLNTCKNLVRYLNISENVMFVGIITPEKYRSYLEDSIAFVQHSVEADDGSSEGTPVSVLEASAAGVPVVATMHAGIPDVVIDEETGFLVAEHDVNGMAKRMVELLHNRDLGKAMGLKGRENILKNFSMEKHIDILNKLIWKAGGLKNL